MGQSATALPVFASPVAPPPEVDFGDGRLTGDGGCPEMACVIPALGLCAAVAAVIPEKVPLFPRTRRRESA
jgi:hypothetical protein